MMILMMTTVSYVDKTMRYDDGIRWCGLVVMVVSYSSKFAMR